MVPALVKALGKRPGTWSEVFTVLRMSRSRPPYQSRYVNAITEEGKREFNIPMYCNVWPASAEHDPTMAHVILCRF